MIARLQDQLPPTTPVAPPIEQAHRLPHLVIRSRRPNDESPD